MKLMLIISSFFIISLLLTGCISEEPHSFSKLKKGLLINSVYHNGWFDIPNSVELFFIDESIKITATEFGSFDWFYYVSQYNVGYNITMIYHNDLESSGVHYNTLVLDSWEGKIK